MKTNLSIFRILRLITPEEIEELTSSSTGGAQESLTSLMLSQLANFDAVGHSDEDDSGAKILPFNMAAGKKSKRARDSIDDEIEGHSKRAEEAETRREEAIRLASEKSVQFNGGSVAFDEEVQLDEKLDTSVFILAEQRKLKKSQERLKIKEVIGLYQKNAAVSVEQEKKVNEDMSKSTYSGILINRRRF
ncbi:MAG: hypothetical protein KAG61_02645 [Bacteriovoracaceae bacterium]|nr:hypothetical protein [Bacteriovoracaceae bacterium]